MNIEYIENMNRFLESHLSYNFRLNYFVSASNDCDTDNSYYVCSYYNKLQHSNIYMYGLDVCILYAPDHNGCFLSIVCLDAVKVRRDSQR